MAAITKNLKIEAGATYNIGFVYHAPTLDENGEIVLDPDGRPVPGDPIPLDGCSARMQVRAKVSAPEALITATTATDESLGANRIFLQLQDATGSPIIGRFDIILSDVDTMALNAVKKAVYDLELIWPIRPGEMRPRVDRLIQGEIVVEPNVTRVETIGGVAVEEVSGG